MYKDRQTSAEYWVLGTVLMHLMGKSTREWQSIFTTLCTPLLELTTGMATDLWVPDEYQPCHTPKCMLSEEELDIYI